MTSSATCEQTLSRHGKLLAPDGFFICCTITSNFMGKMHILRTVIVRHSGIMAIQDSDPGNRVTMGINKRVRRVASRWTELRSMGGEGAFLYSVRRAITRPPIDSRQVSLGPRLRVAWCYKMPDVQWRRFPNFERKYKNSKNLITLIL